MPTPPSRPRLAILALLGVWIVASFAGGAGVARLFLVRDATLTVTIRNAGPIWELAWHADAGFPRNGHWIDLAELLGDDVIRTPRTATPLTTPAPLELRRRLANHPLRDVSLAWHDSPDATLTLAHARVSHRLLDVPLGSRPLAVRGVEGAAPAGPEGVYRTTAPAGRIVFDPPRTPWFAWVLPAPLVALVLLVGAFLAHWLVRAFFRAPPADALPAAHPTRTALPLRLVTLAVVVGVPVWMHAWAPMMHSGDGTAYAVPAFYMLQNANFDHFDGWRLPGYALILLPFIAWSDDFTIGLGVLQTAMAIASSLLAWGMLRTRLGPRVSAAGAMLVACDPALIVWQRSILTEQTTILWIMLGASLLVRTGDRVVRRAPSLATLGLGALLGLVLAGACLTRPNLQVIAALAPLSLLLLSLRARTFTGVGAGLVCAIVCLAGVAPMLAHTHRLYGRVALTVGSDWNRAIWTWENGLLDWNQSGVLSFEQFEHVRRRCTGIDGHFASWDFLHLCRVWKVPPVPPGVHDWEELDRRSAILWKETFARRAERMGAMSARAVASMLAVPFREPRYFTWDPRFLADVYIGEEPNIYGTTNRKDSLEFFDEPVQHAFRHTVRDVAGLHESPHARALGAAYDLAQRGRPVVVLAFLVGMVRLVRRGDWVVVFVGALFLAHALAVPLMVFTGNLRYTMPWYALVTVVTLIGLFARRATPAPHPEHAPISSPPRP